MCRHQLIPLLALTLTLGGVPAQVCQAQWLPDGAPVCTAEGSQVEHRIISDGAGGAIITWQDLRSGNAIYAQRVNAAGVRQWTVDGVALGSQGAHAAIASDGAGGAIVTWEDYRGVTSVYAQRVNAAGMPQWTPDGVAMCSGCGLPGIESDGAGGAIVTWAVNALGSIYAQRVSGAGAPQWTPNGVTLCPATAVLNNYLSFPTIASDGAEGAIVTWEDYRNGQSDIFTQRVSADGVPQWAPDGVALCTVVGDQRSPTIASDGAGGAIVTWTDGRVTTDPNDIYAQRVSADGAPQWTADGVALCTVGNDQAYPGIVWDGAAGAIVTWQDRRGGTQRYVYAQRVSAAGAPQWTADGVALGLAADDPLPFTPAIPTIASDGAGGAIVTCSGAADIYAQRVDQAGAPQWTASGVALSTGTEGIDPRIVSDGAGGAIVTWTDRRSGPHTDIYAQRVYGSGGIVAVSPPSAPAHFQLFAPSPNPTRNGEMTIRFNLPSSERVSAEVLDLGGRRVRTLATDREFPPGTQVLGWDGRNDAGVSLPSGVYFVDVRVGTHAETRRAVLLH